MSREGLAVDEPVLNRRKGRLTNVEQYVEGGERWFLCRCECGGQRKVKAKVFNADNVTACEECVRNGLAPKLNLHHPPRTNVSLDWEPLAALGFDIDLPANRSGKVIRQLLSEWAYVIRRTNVPLTPDQWGLLATALVIHPQVLSLDATAAVVLATLAERTTPELREGVTYFGTTQVLAALAALRWRLDHPNDEGEWWRPEVRMGEV
jgi:hypothetical protein